MKTPTICIKVCGLIGVLILLSCTSEKPPQPQPNPPLNAAVIPEPRIIIDSPEGGSVGLIVTFQWHIQEAKEGENYRYKVRLDKGQNACDSGIEEEFDAETKTCLKVDLSPDRYSNSRVEFAIQATDSQGRGFCAQGGRFLVDPKLPSSPGCESKGEKKEEANKNGYRGSK